jgi:adenosylcobinamide-phosphate synthase
MISCENIVSLPHAGLVQITIAFILDLIFGDPQWHYHPVRLIGRFIEWVESILRRLPAPERLSGMLLTACVVSVAYFAAFVVVLASRQWHSWFGMVMGGVVIYFTISVRCLANEAKKVMAALRRNDMEGARQALSQIVGRDTAHLSAEQIARACVETVAEGCVDGVLSPLFYAFIGGPCAAMAYRAVNTLDSMVGHKDERYIRFGWASARLDDVANYIPARISAVLIPCAALFCGGNFRKAFAVMIRDGRKHASPNSGIPEAAMAGALGVRLGGLSAYQGEMIEKPFIGDGENPLAFEAIGAAIRIMYGTSALFLVCGVGAVVCWKYL